MHKTIAFALAACFAGSAAAQHLARPDPADPKASAPARAYDSAFKDYRPYADPDLARWREANEEVGRLGGHVGHAGRGKPAPKPPALVSGEKHK